MLKIIFIFIAHRRILLFCFLFFFSLLLSLLQLHIILVTDLVMKVISHVQVLNMLCCWVEDPNSEAFKMHLPRIYDFLWVAEDGMKMQVEQ